MEVGTWVCRACAFFIICIFWSLWTCSQEASLSNRKSAREECRASKANRWSWGETQRTEKGRSSILYAAGFGVWFSWWWVPVWLVVWHLVCWHGKLGRWLVFFDAVQCYLLKNQAWKILRSLLQNPVKILEVETRPPENEWTKGTSNKHSPHRTQ